MCIRDSGKLINDGSRTAVIGIAFPGLQENLAISKDKLEIPDYVEIAADVSSFRLDMTVTVSYTHLQNSEHYPSVFGLFTIFFFSIAHLFPSSKSKLEIHNFTGVYHIS